jgi:beta-galactosidase
MVLKKAKFFIFFLFVFQFAKAQSTISGEQLFDMDWRFYRGGVERGEFPTFDDSKWRIVDLPHDWSIEDLPETHSPFNPDAVSQVSGGFTTGGTGWYRKSFVIPSDQKGKSVIIYFEGIYMNADIWLNGIHLGNHPYGYTSFWYDITEKIKFGGNNIIAVQVKNEGLNSRWYSGSGINRHVWLRLANPIHIAQWGSSLNTSNVTTASALVSIKTKIENHKNSAASLTIKTSVIDQIGRSRGSVSTGSNVEKEAEISQAITVDQPVLWSTENPYLYKVLTQVFEGGSLVDESITNLGIRYLSIDAQNGFLLNGKQVKLKGACYHNDNGPLGSRSYDRAEVRRVELLKASGFNAIRCSHNPPAPAFLDACDSLGILVIDEAFDMWKEAKTPYDYHLYFDQWWKSDIESMVMRDRNHPSIIMWSIGNEIPNRHKTEVVEVAKMLRDQIKMLDPSRSITSAVNDVREDKDPYFSLLDVAGYNYAVDKYESDHQRKPERIIMATESFPLEAFEYWMGVKDHPYVIGDFVWTGFDYIGEASIGWKGYYQEKNFYPWNLAYCGDIDICGWKRPQSYYRDVLWKPGQLSIFVKPPKPSFELNPNIESWSKWNWEDVVNSWNWQGAKDPLDVVIYSSCDEVELFLNDKSLGKKATNRMSKYMATWKVPYQEGELKAIGFVNHKRLTQAVLQTAKEPLQIRLTADKNQLKSNGEDLSYITVELIDNKSIKNPNADNLIKFSIEGPASIVGVGNANPVSVESYQLPERKAWQGRCLVIIKSGMQKGRVILKAESEGLKSSEIEINLN